MPLREVLAKVRDALSRASGLAVYLAGGTALNDADLATLQKLHKPVGGGLGLTNLDTLYVYNLHSLQGGQECTPTSGLACAGQTARGGTYQYLWFNGWRDNWVRHLVLDDLEEVKPGTFSNHNFASVSLGSVPARSARWRSGTRPTPGSPSSTCRTSPRSAATRSGATSTW